MTTRVEQNAEESSKLALGTSLAHVAELPGKLRLDEATYKAVQAIYYPGFTLVGLVGEFGGMIALAVLLYLSPTPRAASGETLPRLFSCSPAPLLIGG